MKISIIINGKEIPLIITPEGDFILSESKTEGEEYLFSSEEFGNFSLVIPEEREELDIGFSKFIELGKGLSLLDQGILFIAYKILKPYMGASLQNLIKKIFGENLLNNFLIEGILGEFSYENYELKIEKLTEDFFKNTQSFYTHVVGFGYRIKEFLLNGKIVVEPGERVYAVWEKENPHDEHAVAIYHESGKKLGYLRKSLAPYINVHLKRKLILKGRILKIMPEYYNPNERVFIELSL